MSTLVEARAQPLARRLVYLRDLTREMVLRDVRGKYKRSVLGLAWAMLNPLLHLLVFYFLFQIIMGVHTPRFTSFALVGLLVWGWSAGALSQGASAITANSTLLRHPGFPSAMLPLINVTTHMVYFLMALPVLLVFLVADGSRPGWGLLALPLVFAVQFVFTLSLAYLVAALNAHFRDTEHLLDVALRLMMFLSPIFYAASRVPEAYQSVYQLNPMVALLDGYRALMMFGTQPDWRGLALVGLISAVALFFALRVYQHAVVRTVDEL